MSFISIKIQQLLNENIIKDFVKKLKKYANYYFSHIQNICYFISEENQVAVIQFLLNNPKASAHVLVIFYVCIKSLFAK